MRYPAAETAQKHERILNEASKLFLERGFTGVSVAEIMKAAQLTHGPFYNHFDSKEALMTAGGGAHHGDDSGAGDGQSWSQERKGEVSGEIPLFGTPRRPWQRLCHAGLGCRHQPGTKSEAALHRQGKNGSRCLCVLLHLEIQTDSAIRIDPISSSDCGRSRAGARRRRSRVFKGDS